MIITELKIFTNIDLGCL